MTERPILLPGPMVCAILEGRKTQTRQVIAGVSPDHRDPHQLLPDASDPHHEVMFSPPAVIHNGHARAVIVPVRFHVGDLLWVRETWAVQHALDPLKPSEMRTQDARLHWAASMERGGLFWRSPLHMPRWASRITLRVTDVRVQRLQEISEEDAKAEGCKADDAFILYQAAFAVRWDSINHKRMPWASNPWVWAISFERTS